MAKRIDVHYGGRLYTIGGRDIDAVRDEITTAIATGHGWLPVNDGEGVARPTELLITPGVDVSLAEIPGDLDA